MDGDPSPFSLEGRPAGERGFLSEAPPRLPFRRRHPPPGDSGVFSPRRVAPGSRGPGMLAFLEVPAPLGDSPPPGRPFLLFRRVCLSRASSSSHERRVLLRGFISSGIGWPPRGCRPLWGFAHPAGILRSMAGSAELGSFVRQLRGFYPKCARRSVRPGSTPAVGRIPSSSVTPTARPPPARNPWR